MQYQSFSDTHIICAPVPLNNQQTETAFEIQTREFPISWYGTLDVLEEMPHAFQSVCLAIDLADIVSKHRFRMQLRSARSSGRTTTGRSTTPSRHIQSSGLCAQNKLSIRHSTSSLAPSAAMTPTSSSSQASTSCPRTPQACSG